MNCKRNGITSMAALRFPKGALCLAITGTNPPSGGMR